MGLNPPLGVSLGGIEWLPRPICRLAASRTRGSSCGRSRHGVFSVAMFRHAIMEDVTLILRKFGNDQKLLSEQLLPLIYDELRGLAASRMSREDTGQTLQPTA